jgi:rSAM/selenodomain-associated transferase 1
MTDRLVIFAREPVPGRVKTRLAEGLGAGPAAAAYGALLDHTLAVARRSEVELLIALAEVPDPRWRPSIGCRVEIQGRGDLGSRMAECFRRRFTEGSERAVIVGSDIGRLRAAHITAAFAALDHRPVVLGPADDGGYWLVGQQSPGMDLFSGIPWSRPETLAATRDRLLALGVEWSELETLPDIDTVEDLQKAIEDRRIDRGLRRRLAAAVKPLATRHR